MSWEVERWQEMKLEETLGGRSQVVLNAVYDRAMYCSPNIHLLPTFPSLLAVGGNHVTSFTNMLYMDVTHVNSGLKYEKTSSPLAFLPCHSD